MLGGGEAHLLKRVAGGFEGVDLGGGELVGGGLVPVGAVHLGDVGGVEDEALGFDVVLPIGARGEGDALHYSPAPPPCPPLPSPPPECPPLPSAKKLPKPPRVV